MDSTWDWQIFLEDRGDGLSYFEWLMSAWGWTLSVSALAFVVALLLGTLMGILRTTPSRALVLVGDAWTELFRNIPLLVQLFLWYNVVPYFLPAFQRLPGFVLVVFALGFFTSARISEQVKAGLQALPKGQRYAGLAMGFSLPQTYRFVLMPMAVRIVIPPLISEAMNLIKNSSVAFAVSVTELTFFFQQAGEETSKPIMMFLAAAALYALTNMVVKTSMRFIEKRTRIPGLALGGK